MDGLLGDPARLSQLELLVAQQRYDESLELLNDAITSNPQDRVACLCRLLVARIVMLRWPLAGLSQFRLSKLRVLSLGLAWASSACMVRRAVCRIAISLRPQRIFRWPGTLLRLGAVRATLPDKLRVYRAQRFGLLASEQGSPRTRWRRSLPVTVASALCLLAAFAVSAVLLRSGATSPRPSLHALARGMLPPAVVKPPAKPLPPANSVRERAPFAEPQERTLPTTGKPLEKAKQERLPRVQQVNTRGDVRPHNSEPVAKKNQSAVLRNMNNIAHPKKAPAGGMITKTSVHFYRAQRPIEVRQAARYAAPTVEKLSEGTVVAVLDVQNSWARVTLAGKAPGFVRIEHLGPVDIP